MNTTALNTVREFPDRAWLPGAAAPTAAMESVLEDGGVLSFPHLPFELDAREQRFLDAGSADGRAKNISLRWRPGETEPELRGGSGSADDLAAMRAMIARFAEHSQALVARLFPHYTGHLRRGNTSFRPMPIEGRVTSWRQDDTRLHVDAFPSNPTHGKRLLRVFTNLNPDGRPRVWRVGERFEDFARRYLPQVRRPLPGSARLLHALHITKARRSEYDHVMLRLHDLAKADPTYQREAPQQGWNFMPGTTWICFSDQVLHAAMGGQHMLEQTFVLEPQHLQRPETSPLRTLERLLGRPLLDH